MSRKTFVFSQIIIHFVRKLLDRLSLLEEVNKLKGKNIPFHQDTFLRDPLVSTIRQNLTTSDYESDMDFDSDDDDLNTVSSRSLSTRVL